MNKETLTNNMGAITKDEIESFCHNALTLLGLDDFQMKWTTAGNILIPPYVYIDERTIGKYPWEAKQTVLHEIAHIYSWPEDMVHGEIFFSAYIKLLSMFLTRRSHE